jgi:hypothetical protein
MKKRSRLALKKHYQPFLTNSFLNLYFHMAKQGNTEGGEITDHWPSV